MFIIILHSYYSPRVSQSYLYFLHFLKPSVQPRDLLKIRFLMAYYNLAPPTATNQWSAWGIRNYVYNVLFLTLSKAFPASPASTFPSLLRSRILWSTDTYIKPINPSPILKAAHLDICFQSVVVDFHVAIIRQSLHHTEQPSRNKREPPRHLYYSC